MRTREMTFLDPVADRSFGHAQNVSGFADRVAWLFGGGQKIGHSYLNDGIGNIGIIG